MRTDRTAFFAILLILVLLPAPAASAQGDAPSDTQRLTQLEEENLALRQELAELRMALAQLRRAHEALLAEQAEGRGEPGEAPDADAPDGDAMPDEAQGEDEEQQVRTYATADQVYRAIPAELSPARDGWGIVSVVEAKAWLTDNIPGSRFEARLEVRDVQIDYHETRGDWTVAVHFTARPMRFMQWGMEERVGVVTLRGDGEFANRARRLEAGARVQVTGTIDTVGWDTLRVQDESENWHPTYCTLNLRDASVRSPHLRR